MVKKTPLKGGKFCRVTFTAPVVNGAREVRLLGEFNGWDAEAHPLKKRKTGCFSTSLTLETGRLYRYRYLLDGTRWENDESADAYAPNAYGTTDSIVEL